MRELSLHILDLVQNSLEAGSSDISLKVIEDTVNDQLVIVVSDNGRGMSNKQKNKVADPFFTSRYTRRVGLGLPLIDMYTKLCDGKLDVVSNLAGGTTVTAVFRYSHIDRPPLGNMVDTIKIIIVANPNINFSYRHIVGHNQFYVATNDIIKALGGIPLSFPDVIVWLDRYLTDNLDLLYRGVVNEND